MGETLADEDITTVYAIISKYVTDGEGASTRQMAELYERLPRPLEGMTLHRVLRLTSDQMTQYKRDASFELRPTEYASWTKCDDAAKLLAQTKGEHVIIVTQYFPAREIVIDISAFYEEHDFTDYNHSEYRKYVLPEQEVIVRHIEPLQVSERNSRAYDHSDVPHPMIGDEVFYFGEDEPYEIEDVDHEQPFKGRGIYNVHFNMGTEGVRYLGRNHSGINQWEACDHFIHK